MSIQNEKYINVLNENNFVVTVTSGVRAYTFKPKAPGFIAKHRLTWEEIMYINTTTKAFRNGLLTFEKEQRAEALEALGIFELEDHISEEDIKDMILHPDADKMQKIVDIKDMISMDRVRGVFYSMKNSGAYDLSSRVESIIDQRALEILGGKMTSKIVVKPVAEQVPASSKDVDDVKAQNEELKEQLKIMQQQIEAINAAAAAKPVEVETAVVEPEVTAETEKPAKTTKATAKKTTRGAEK